MTTPTTTTRTTLLDCPNCQKPIGADLSFDVKLDPIAHSEGELHATATLELAGVHVSHGCPLGSGADRMTLGYYRHPSMNGRTECPKCGQIMQEHGWLDTGGDGIIVCPSPQGPFAGQTVTELGRAAKGGQA